MLQPDICSIAIQFQLFRSTNSYSSEWQSQKFSETASQSVVLMSQSIMINSTNILNEGSRSRKLLNDSGNEIDIIIQYKNKFLPYLLVCLPF